MTIDKGKNRQRAFYITLDPESGHEILAKQGFVPASPHVTFAETRNVARQWARLHALGIIDDVDQFSEWYTDMLSTAFDHDLPEIMKIQHRAIVMTFFNAALLMLHNEGKLKIKDFDKVKLHEILKDPEFKGADDYKELMEEFEEMMKSSRLVEEPEVQDEQ